MNGPDAAVLALHYQNDVLHPEGKIRVGLDADGAVRQRVLHGAAALLDGARGHGLPIVHVRIAFRPDYADLLPNCDIFRNVASIGAFYGTPLEETLRLLGARRLVVAGVATHSVVEGTVRHAADIGFNVMVAEDACASADPAVHDASLASMRLIAQTGSVAQAMHWAAAPH